MIPPLKGEHEAMETMKKEEMAEKDNETD